MVVRRSPWHGVKLSTQRAGSESLADLERQEILAWASEICEQDIVLAEGVPFVEEPLRPVNITKVSQYVGDRLRFIVHAHFQQRTGGMGRWLPSWWKEREKACIGALISLRSAMCGPGEEAQVGGGMVEVGCHRRATNDEAFKW